MSSAQAVDESLYEGSAGQPGGKVDGLYLKFYRRPVENKLKSWGGMVVRPDGTEVAVQGEGRLICEEIEYIEIVTPGDKTNIVDRPVRDSDRRQFARQYQAWKAGDNEQLTGTPLSAWPGVTRAQVEELGYFKIRTVEQLASVSDGNLMQVGPIRALRQRAQDFISVAAGSAPIEAMRAQMQAKDAEMAALKLQVAELVKATAEKAKSK